MYDQYTYMYMYNVHVTCMYSAVECSYPTCRFIHAFMHISTYKHEYMYLQCTQNANNDNTH